MKILISLFLLFIISCAPVRYQTNQIVSKTPAGKDTRSFYLIKRGDSLWRISKKYGVTVEDIIKENKLSSPKDLIIGQKLYIPYQCVNKNNSSFMWPIRGEVINFFKENVDNTINKGLNIKITNENKDVKASIDGNVVFSNYLKGWGKTIILKHENNFYTVYANLDITLVNAGTFAKKTQPIGTVASSKNGDYIFHFEIRKNSIPKDPLQYLN
ncbi:MAG: peptidoglycan DD-metalloendopeptidase family protein [Candidatus Omnitrophica bacterium]|nr:peptidoglycan DD-metalloendopeptidase family protein [Candidatus Omnitrophota bacterium]